MDNISILGKNVRLCGLAEGVILFKLKLLSHGPIERPLITILSADHVFEYCPLVQKKPGSVAGF
jgi:hypothetical protein